MEPNIISLVFVILALLVLIVLQARKPVKRHTWPEPKPPQLLHVKSIAEIPLSYYAAGNAVVLDRTLLIFDGSNWIEPRQSGCPTCGRPYA